MLSCKFYVYDVFLDIVQNALDLTAPASDVLLRNRKNSWVQLAGHPGMIDSLLLTAYYKQPIHNLNNCRLLIKR